MIDFLDEFFKSDMFLNNIPQWLAIIILCIIFGAFIMWLYNKFFHIPWLKKKLEEVQAENKKMRKKNKDLSEKKSKQLAEIKKLKEEIVTLHNNLNTMSLAKRMLEDEKDTSDPGLEHFIKR